MLPWINYPNGVRGEYRIADEYISSIRTLGQTIFLPPSLAAPPVSHSGFQNRMPQSQKKRSKNPGWKFALPEKGEQTQRLKQWSQCFLHTKDYSIFAAKSNARDSLLLITVPFRILCHGLSICDREHPVPSIFSKFFPKTSRTRFSPLLWNVERNPAIKIDILSIRTYNSVECLPCTQTRIGYKRR